MNEVRDELGLAPVDGGDSVMAPFNLTPVGSPKPTPPVKNTTQRFSYPALAAAKLKASLGNAVDKAIESIVSKASAKLSAAQQASRWHDFVSRVTPYELLLKKKMATYAKGMAERAIGNLEEQTKAFDLTALLDPRQEVRVIVSVVRPILDELFKNEGRASADMIGGAFDETEARVNQAVDDATNLMAGKYQEETTRLLNEALKEGLAAGEGIDKLSNRISDIGEFSSDIRADRVATTEAFRVANMAGREAYRQSGVENLVWYTADDGDVCEFCAELHGTVVGIDDNFYDLGDTATGAEGGSLAIDYTDIVGGALHPNCRCQVVPEVAELED